MDINMYKYIHCNHDGIDEIDRGKKQMVPF